MIQSSGSEEIITQYYKLIDGVSLDIIREINIINSKLLSVLPPLPRVEERDIDKDFLFVPDLFETYSFDSPSQQKMIYTVTESEPEGYHTRQRSKEQEEKNEQPTELVNQHLDKASFLSSLWEEIESLGLAERSKKQERVITQWITDEPNSFLKSAIRTDNFPAISKLRDIVNEHEHTMGNMNGCIINCFKGNVARGRPHADDEPYIDQSSSICTLSLGAVREFKIFEKTHNNPKCLKTFTLNPQSMTFMQPGTQSYTKHKVMPGNNDDENKVRVSISFRHILSDKSAIGKTSRAAGPTKTAVIFGSSIPYYLNEKRLGGKRESVRVINASSRGAKISNVFTQMNTISNGSHGYFNRTGISIGEYDIQKVIISVGTNDISNLNRRGVNHLYLSVEGLIKKAQALYPNADIYFQSVLPMPYGTDSALRDNVLNFNDVLYRVCKLNRCYFLDIFDSFLHSNGVMNYGLFRVDRYGKPDVHLSSSDLSLLARAYIDKISRYRIGV